MSDKYISAGLGILVPAVPASISCAALQQQSLSSSKASSRRHRPSKVLMHSFSPCRLSSGRYWRRCFTPNAPQRFTTLAVFSWWILAREVGFTFRGESIQVDLSGMGIAEDSD